MNFLFIFTQKYSALYVVYIFTAYCVKQMQKKQILPLLLGGLSSVLGIRKSSVGSACVLEQINQHQTTSTHIGRHVLILIYFTTSIAACESGLFLVEKYI